MELDFHWVNILILFGAIQGMVFMGILLFHRKHPGWKFLALVILALVYNALETLNWSTGFDKYTIFFDFFPFVTIFLIGPGFYLYYKSLLKPGYVAGRKEILLAFGPFLFQLIYASITTLGYFAYFKLDLKLIEVPLTWMFRIYDVYSEVWSVTVYTFFTGLSLVLVRKIVREKNGNNHKNESLNWVRILLAFQVVFVFGWIQTLLSPIWYDEQNGSRYYPIELFLVLFLYWAAMAGFWKVKSIQTGDSPKSKEPHPEAFVTLDLLQKAMDADNLYLNPNLNLQMVADHIDLAPKEISYALNQAGKTNFNDFVNNKRIEAFCNRMDHDSKPNLTMFGIAQECGFNSPATFQRAFKKAKNMSPKVFLSGIPETKTAIKA